MNRFGLFILLSFFTQPVFAQIPKVDSGKIVHYSQFPSAFVKPRNIDIWLPNNYDPTKQYDVLYMQDGKGLFDATIMWNNQEWGVDETITKLINEQKIRPCIVVGIWNGETLRHAEFTPQKPFEQLTKDEQKAFYKVRRSNGDLIFTGKVQSNNYLKFIVKELKPYIDSTFSVYKDQAHTFIAGSSMGALVSLYAICEYPEIFGGAACLSTHWTVKYTTDDNNMPTQILTYLDKKYPSPLNHKLYFDFGDQTLDTLYKPYQVSVNKLFKIKRYNQTNFLSREFVGHNHSEESWNRRLFIPLEFLLSK